MTAESRFAALAKKQFISLKTFRKSGEAIPTPVWFAQDGERVYVMTLSDTGKVKRIRNNGQVEIAPCTYNGKLLGVDYIPATARLLSADEGKQANQRLNRKYGIQKRFFDFLQRNKQQVYLEIVPR